ncbi:hypothetical protein A5714_22700 [Mycobacterium sp. E2462]|nr:hypothetical protein A5700_12325 [Mycobacterium sp. E1214]OBH22079.1 hypothetical protein A5693_14720 [Mycobacterium sp. E1319]OBI07245.1 hypothetical protein A5714_22700 [Mycobacterium sp. E2462]
MSDNSTHAGQQSPPPPPGFNEAQTQERPIPPIPTPLPHHDDHPTDPGRPRERDPGGALPPSESTQPAYRFDPDPFDPFGEGA